MCFGFEFDLILSIFVYEKVYNQYFTFYQRNCGMNSSLEFGLFLFSVIYKFGNENEKHDQNDSILYFLSVCVARKMVNYCLWWANKIFMKAVYTFYGWLELMVVYIIFITYEKKGSEGCWLWWWQRIFAVWNMKVWKKGLWKWHLVTHLLRHLELA